MAQVCVSRCLFITAWSVVDSRITALKRIEHKMISEVAKHSDFILFSSPLVDADDGGEDMPTRVH